MLGHAPLSSMPVSTCAVFLLANLPHEVVWMGYAGIDFENGTHTPSNTVNFLHEPVDSIMAGDVSAPRVRSGSLMGSNT